MLTHTAGCISTLAVFTVFGCCIKFLGVVKHDDELCTLVNIMKLFNFAFKLNGIMMRVDVTKRIVVL